MGLRYFLFRLWDDNKGLADDSKGVRVRSKPLWNKVKEMLKWLFYAKKGSLGKGS